MIEHKLEKGMRPIPVPCDELETFPKHMEEFFDLIARRPFELFKERPLLLGRELEHFWKTEPELIRPILLKMYETAENLVVRAEVPGCTGKELNITCEPWRIVITGRKEIKEEGKIEKKEGAPTYVEKGHIYKSVKFPVEVKPDAVRATLKNGILEVVLPKAELVKKVSRSATALT